MSHQRTVYLIDDLAADRRILGAQLTALGAEAWPFASGSEFLGMVDHLPPACVLLNIEAGSMDGLTVLAELVRREIDWPVIAVSAGDDLRVAIGAMKLGAIDFLRKPLEPEPLAAALAFAGSALEKLIEASEARLQAQGKAAKLTPREKDIALALLSGEGNKSTAHQLGISVRTVEMHRSNIMAKLGARSLAEAAVLLMQAGLAPSHGEDPSYRKRCALESFLEAQRARQSAFRIGATGGARGSDAYVRRAAS